MTGTELLDSGRRFAVTMWEYSWLTQRTGRQAEYADWDKVLDELVERGYNCIRIDAFPHIIAADADGNCAKETTFRPSPITLCGEAMRPLQSMCGKGWSSSCRR